MKHFHRCVDCKRHIVPCGGYRVDNYDGWPPVLCSVEAALDFDPSWFLCEDCEHEREVQAAIERQQEQNEEQEQPR